jgi:dolichol-phosphate mannosyltransferase
MNEEDNVKPLYKRLKKTLNQITPSHEIIFVDDGSSDKTVEEVMSVRDQDDCVKLVSFSRNFGHEMANSAGFRKASGQAVVIIDGDLQDPPELIKDMYDKYKEGFDVVYAKRATRKKESFLKKLTSKMFYSFMKFMSYVELPLDTGDFRLLSRRVVDEINKMDEHNRFFRGITHWVGFNVTYVEFNRDGRHAGETKYNYFKLIRLAIDALLSFSDKPLKIFSIFGIGMSLFSFLFMIYWVVYKLVTDNPIAGWTSTVTIILFFFGILMLQISVLGEYIARIYEEVRRRPLYIIQKQEGLDDEDKRN